MSERKLLDEADALMDRYELDRAAEKYREAFRVEQPTAHDWANYQRAVEYADRLLIRKLAAKYPQSVELRLAEANGEGSRRAVELYTELLAEELSDRQRGRVVLHRLAANCRHFDTDVDMLGTDFMYLWQLEGDGIKSDALKMLAIKTLVKHLSVRADQSILETLLRELPVSVEARRVLKRQVELLIALAELEISLGD